MDVLVFACSGAANVGEAVDLAARRLRAEGLGSLSCLAALVGGAEEFVGRARRADAIVVLDGCAANCAGTLIERFALPIEVHVCATDLGLEKVGLGARATEEDVTRIVDHVTGRLAS